MFKNSGFFKSLENALSGLLFAVKTERNLRFHLCVGNLICLFAYFFGLTRTQWAILFLTILAVVSAELFNTAIERSVDTATDKICEQAKYAKDTAAGATLVCALFSLIVGIFLFADIKKIKNALIALFSFGFSGIFEFLLLFAILMFNIWLLFFCSRRKG